MQFDTFDELRLTGNLPSPAGVGLRILQLTRTDDYSAEDMREAIMADSSLTGRILMLANSAANTGLEPATTVSGAIMRLGSRTVRDLALAFSLVSDRSGGSCRAFDYEDYWSRSLARAVAAQVISRVIGLGRPEEAYICGLLGQIGRLALASVFPTKYARLIERNPVPTPAHLLGLERETFNIDHATVGACLLRDWGLPESFAEAVHEFCSSTDVPTGGIQGMAELLSFARVIASACVAQETTDDSEWIRIGDGLDALRSALGFDEAGFLRCCQTCVDEWVAWGERLEIATASGLRFSSTVQRIAVARGNPRSPAATFEGAQRRGEREPRTEPSEAIQILAVDDDPVSLRLLVLHLEQEGYRVTSAASGRDGLKLALSNPPEILVADWEMPGLDGLELCVSLRRTDVGRNMYFLLLTGHQSEELLVRAFDAGVDDFVAKPFIPRLLFARIKGGVRLAQLHRKIERDKQVMMRQVADLGVMTRKLRAASLTDPLTDLPNRRYAMKRLASEWAAMLRTSRPLSVVMIDIDHFKRVNDTFGHDVGDVVLKKVTQLIGSATRTSDELCRLGGEEFLVICKNTNEVEGAVAAERIRQRVAESIIGAPFEGSITISLGLASSDSGVDGVAALFKLADDAVYLAKRSGRNQVRTGTEAYAARLSA